MTFTSWEYTTLCINLCLDKALSAELLAGASFQGSVSHAELQENAFTFPSLLEVLSLLDIALVLTIALEATTA
jgi:hypothetical protein